MVFMLSACDTKQDAGIIKNWRIDNRYLLWEEVDEAAYYEILFFNEDDFEHPISFDNYYVYAPEFSLATFNNDTDYFVKIRTTLTSKESIDSEIIQFRLDDKFPFPLILGSNDKYPGINWEDLSLNYSSLEDYTLLINGETYTTDEHALNLSFIDANIYEIYIRANYTQGHSVYTPVYYILHSSINSSRVSVYYDSNENEDLEFSLELAEPIMYIEGANRSNYSILDESIISYADSVFTLNRFFIENNGTSPIYTHLNIVTENFVYNVTVYDISMAE
jgi:hypothetical protein